MGAIFPAYSTVLLTSSPFSDLRKLGLNLVPFPRVSTAENGYCLVVTRALASFLDAELCSVPCCRIRTVL